MSICNQNRVHCDNLERLFQEQGDMSDPDLKERMGKMCANAACSCSSNSQGTPKSKRGTDAEEKTSNKGDQASDPDESNGKKHFLSLKHKE